MKKKKTLAIIGESNTGKTTLIVQPLLNFFSENNIGFLSSSSTFKFQDLFKKEIGIFDEFKYNANLKDQFLKLFSWEPLLINIKFKQEEILKNTPVILIMNEDFLEKSEEIKKAFNNRIFNINFYNKIEKIDEEKIKKKLLSEEAEIIIYWNKKLHKKVSNKKNKNNLIRYLEGHKKLIE